MYSITHTTTYQYQEPVSLCHNIAMLSPRDTATQTCKASRIIITPTPEILEEHTDFFGNKVFYFVVEQEHEKLSVTVISAIEKIKTGVSLLPATISWENTRDLLLASAGEYMDEKQFTAATEITAPTQEIRDYAAVSFTAGRSFYDAAYDLMHRIYTDFEFTPGFTTISTPLSIVMQEKKGVCQDFAHLAISCIHAMGLPAKYISGDIETLPARGKEKVAGVDASHAWYSIFIPGSGWIDFDPTNNQVPDEQHITVGWGRDYFDIIPLKGVIMSSSSHELTVSVDVRVV